MKLILYTAPACHLCDLAKELVWPLLEAKGAHLEEVDITQSDRLMKRYGRRIPVLALASECSDESSGQELSWPFEAHEVTDWLKTLSSVFKVDPALPRG